MCNLTEAEKNQKLAQALIKIMQLPSYREDEAAGLAFRALKECGFMDSEIRNLSYERIPGK